MSYYTGVVNSITDVRQALINACTNEGWTWDSGEEVLHKDTLFLLLTISGVDLYATGRTALTTGDMPRGVGVGRLWFRSGFPTYEIEYPAIYHIFVHQDEVYLIVNYSSDRLQWLTFGKSTIENLPGTGMYVSGIRGTPSYTPSDTNPINIGTVPQYTTIGHRGISACAFLTNSAISGSTPQNFMALTDYVHHGFDEAPWALGLTNTGSPVGGLSIHPLLFIQPNTWNSEGILLPIRAYKRRAENRISLVCELNHARYIRVDNYEIGQIVSLGDDDWMVFPFHRKNIESRQGGREIDHTGTFGWAIRYESESS